MCVSELNAPDLDPLPFFRAPSSQVFLAWAEEQRARRGMITFGVELLEGLLGAQNEFIFRELMRKEGLHLLRERVLGALEQALRERTTAVLESIGEAQRTKDAHGEWAVRGREQHAQVLGDVGQRCCFGCQVRITCSCDGSHEITASLPTEGSRERCRELTVNAEGLSGGLYLPRRDSGSRIH